MKVFQCKSDFYKIKTGHLKKRQKYIQIFIRKMFKKMVYFFTRILPDYMTHDITKECWKNSYFENMTAGFPLRCQSHLVTSVNYP